MIIDDDNDNDNDENKDDMVREIVSINVEAIWKPTLSNLSTNLNTLIFTVVRWKHNQTFDAS
mgnify:CR=1 FL=1